MELYNRMMDAQFAYELLKKKDYIFLCAKVQSQQGNDEEKRGTRVKNDLNPVKCFEVEYFCKGTSVESKIEEGFRIIEGKGCEKEFASLRKKDMYCFIEELNLICKNIVIDFTLMNTRFLGAFVALLNMFEWREVYFCYTEPGEYNKDEYKEINLKNTIMGFEQIPNLETFSDSSTKCDWVIFLGFEGSRMIRLNGEAPTRKRYSLPYISIPAMRTKWHNIAMNANREFFELKITDQEKMNYVSAINPFETYERLLNISKDVRLVISPIGPKPVMLGCIMYVLENENEMLLYDNPFQEGSNTTDYGASHFYDLTQFVHSVKNKRYIVEEES